MELTGKTAATACPYKCHENIDMVGAEAALLSEASQTQSQGQDPQVADSQVVIDANEETQQPGPDFDVDEQPILH